MNIVKANDFLRNMSKGLVGGLSNDKNKNLGEETASSGWMPKFFISTNPSRSLWWVMKGGMPIAQKKTLADILKSYAVLVKDGEKDPWAWDNKADKFKRLSKTNFSK